MVFVVPREFLWNLPHSTLEEMILANGRNLQRSKRIIIFLGSCKTEWSFALSYSEENQQFYLRLVNHTADHLEFLVDLKFKAAAFKLKKFNTRAAIGFQGEGLGEAVFNLADRLNMIASGVAVNIYISITLTEKEKPFKRPRSTYRLGDFIPDESYSDFTITCSDDVDIAVHRVLLGKGSQVFSAMLQINMNENKKRKVKIEDVDSVIMTEILSFIYAGNVDLYGYELARDVFYAANKYAITSLEEICIKELIRQTTKEHVIESFIIADLCDIQDLERKCLFLIHKHFVELKETNDWKLLTRDHCDKIIASFYHSNVASSLLENEEN